MNQQPQPVRGVETLHILIIDDQADARETLRNMLTACGAVTVRAVASANEAVTALSRDTFDLVLCDYRLGDSQTGLDLLRCGRTNGLVPYRTQWVLVTADTSKPVFMCAVENEPDDVMSKPFSFHQFRSRIRRWVDRRNTLMPVLGALDGGTLADVVSHCEKLEPEQPRYQTWLQKTRIRALIEHGQLADAGDSLKSLLSDNPRDWMMAELAYVERNRNRLTDACEWANAALAENPLNVRALDQLGTSYRKLGEPELAQQILSRAVRAAPLNERRQVHLGLICCQNRSFAEAARCFRQALDLSRHTDEPHPRYHIRLAELLNQAARLGLTDGIRYGAQESVQVARQAARRFPDSFRIALKSRLLQATAMHYDGVPDRRDLALHEACELATRYVEHVDARQAIELAEHCFELNNDDLGHTWLACLSDHHASDSELQAAIRSLAAEPQEDRRRQAAAALNLSANQAYEERAYRQALGDFLAAMDLTPRHPGLVLNIVQTHVRLFQESGHRIHYLEAHRYLRVLNDLPADHPQHYRREAIRFWLANQADNEITAGDPETQGHSVSATSP